MFALAFIVKNKSSSFIRDRFVNKKLIPGILEVAADYRGIVREAAIIVVAVGITQEGDLFI